MSERTSAPPPPVIGAGDRPAALSFRRRRPEPARFWIGHAPARWPAADGPWLDLAAGGLGGLGASPGGTVSSRLEEAAGSLPPPLEPAGGDGLEDLVYLPPVPATLGDWRDRLAADLLARGLPVLAQVLPGQPAPAAAGSLVCLDPTPALLAGRPAGGDGPTAGCLVAWGLVAGLTDAHDLLAAEAARLAAGGARALVPVAVELTPRQKRRLAGDSDAAFERLFHGPPASERTAARIAAAAGLETYFDRPPLGRPTARSANRRVAARLTQIADLWLRLGRPEAPAQELFRAARWIEEADHDLAALARDGNLGVLSWLEERARGLVEETLERDPPALLDELRAAYLAGPEGRG